MMLPLDASGLAPRTRKKSVRSISGTGNAPADPKRKWFETIFGSWSTLVAEKRQRVPRARTSGGTEKFDAKSWAFGVAEVGRDGVGAMRLANLQKARGHQVEGFFPADLDKLLADPLDGVAETVRIFGERREPHGLGAHVATAHGVVLVPPDIQHAACFTVDRDRNPAVGFAERAIAVDDFGSVLGHVPVLLSDVISGQHYLGPETLAAPDSSGL